MVWQMYKHQTSLKQYIPLDHKRKMALFVIKGLSYNITCVLAIIFLHCLFLYILCIPLNKRKKNSLVVLLVFVLWKCPISHEDVKFAFLSFFGHIFNLIFQKKSICLTMLWEYEPHSQSILFSWSRLKYFLAWSIALYRWPLCIQCAFLPNKQHHVS